MGRTKRPMWAILLVFAVLGIIRVAPRVRAVDLVALTGSGVLAGISIAGLVSGRKSTPE